MKAFLRKRTPKPIWNALKSAKKSAKKLVLRAAKLPHRNGILFIGYAEGDFGLGQSFRKDILAAADANLPFAIYPFNIGIETRLIGAFMPERYDKTHAYDVNIIQVNPDQVPVVLESIDPRITYYTYNVLRTYWELPKALSIWQKSLLDIDEIWAATSFVADAFRDIFAGPITRIPTTVELGDGPWKGRNHFGMLTDRFYFLFSFDYYSSPYRKNPIGVLEAFQRAFSNREENVGLIIKSMGTAEAYPEIDRALRMASVADPRIQVIHGSLPYNDMISLIHAADVYVSLHRAEGFGMGMAEAMSFGRIVIGTNFSGNTDFLTEQTGFPVPYTLTSVKPHEYFWDPEAQMWAEPDINEAARVLRQVFEAPNLAMKRAKAGQMLIRRKYGMAQVGYAIKERLITLGLLEK